MGTCERRSWFALAAVRIALFLCLFLAPFAPRYALAQSAAAPAPPTPGPIHELGDNIIDSFWGWNAALHLGGIAATAIMSPSGADYHVHRFFAQRPYLGAPTELGVEAGDFMPFIVSGSLLAFGYLLDSPREVAGGWAAAQATILAFAYVNLLKALTGRPPPPEDDPTADARELSQTWRFGFLRGGVFHGWPSGHTITATALMSAVATFYADYWWVNLLAYSWAAYTAYTVISFDEGSMHWASDMVAGALMGYAFGSTVGRSYREGLQRSTAAPGEEEGEGVSGRLAPVVGADRMMLWWSMEF